MAQGNNNYVEVYDIYDIKFSEEEEEYIALLKECNGDAEKANQLWKQKRTEEQSKHGEGSDTGSNSG